MVPKTLPLNRLTVGKHTQSVSLQDAAGNAVKYTNTFVVTTSFADLATVIDQYADNALRTTLNGATAVGATGLRLATPFGFRAGQELVDRLGREPGDGDDRQGARAAADAEHDGDARPRPRARPRSAWRATRRTARPARRPPTSNGPIIGQPIVLDTGANQEVVTVKRHIAPMPAAPAPNVVLSAPLAKDHAAGTATSLANVILSAPLTKAHATGVAIANPRPYITAAKATELRTLLADAKAKADASNTAGAIAALEQFKTAAGERAGARQRRRRADRPAATARRSTPRGTGVTVGAADPGAQALRAFNNPIPFRANPSATYKVLDQRPRRWLPPPVDRRLRVDDPAARRRRTASTSRSGTRTSTPAPAARPRRASRCRPARSSIWTRSSSTRRSS